MKKRKLNSTNPKYNPVPKEEIVKVRKEQIATIEREENRLMAYSVFCI